MAATVTAVLDRARSQLGGYYPGASPYGTWYGQRVGAAVYAAGQFCAMGLSWCFDREGALDIFPLHAYTPSGVAWWKARGQWTPGTRGARRGSIVYFDFPGAPARVSHVGIVESVNGDGTLNTIEFNTSGTAAGDQRNGRVVARKRRLSWVVGYGSPAYTAEPGGMGGGMSVPAGVGVPRNGDGSQRLAVDGARGPRTIARWQEVMGTSVDGVISRPRSALIEADQRFLNAAVGADHIRNLTGASRLTVDGDEGAATVKVRQFWLFNWYSRAVLRRPPRASDFDGVLGPDTNRLHQHALNQARAGSRRY